jgi:GT2 family glycosyltransferase
MNKVDIVIPVHNNYELVKRCIETILDSVTSNWSRIGQIIIVDDHSTEGDLKEYLTNEEGNFFYPPAEIDPPYINLIKPPQRSYFSGAVNFGSEFVTSKYMMILNSDTKVYTKKWVTIMMDEFEKEGNVAILAPSIVGYFNPEPTSGSPKFGQSMVGASCWLLETEYFRSSGKLLQHGKYIHWHSDAEYCRRVISDGKKIGRSSAYIQHWGGQSGKFVESHIPKG